MMATVVLPAERLLEKVARVFLGIIDVPERPDLVDARHAGPPEEAAEGHQRIAAHGPCAEAAMDRADVLPVEVVPADRRHAFGHERMSLENVFDAVTGSRPVRH